MIAEDLRDLKVTLMHISKTIAERRGPARFRRRFERRERRRYLRYFVLHSFRFLT